MYAEEADILARKTAAYIHELQQQPKTLYISENKAYDMFKESIIKSWVSDCLLTGYQRKSGRVEYKLSELNQLAAEHQYPFWKIKPSKK